MRRHAALLLVFLALRPVAADEENLSNYDLAARVAQAVEAGDKDALKRLAGRKNNDPWWVAYNLCLEGRHDAAKAYAALFKDRSHKGLVAYVRSRRGKVADKTGNDFGNEVAALIQKGQHQAALQRMAQAQTPDDPMVHAFVVFKRGQALWNLHRYAEAGAAYWDAATRSRKLGWLAWACEGSWWCAKSYDNIRDYRRALIAWEFYVEVAEVASSRIGLINGIFGLGWARFNWKGAKSALPDFERALALAEAAGSKWHIGRAHKDIGAVHKNLGEYEESLTFYRRAKEEFEALNDREQMAMVHNHTGVSLMWLGDYGTAHASFEQAYALAQELKFNYLLRDTTQNLGYAHLWQGNPSKALPFFGRWLAVSEKMGDRHDVAEAYQLIGQAQAALGNYSDALASYERSYAGFSALNDQHGGGDVLAHMGELYGRLGDTQTAYNTLQRALKLFAGNHDRGIARVQSTMGWLYAESADYDDALAWYEKARKGFEALRDKPGLAKVLVRIGSVRLERGRYEKARTEFKRALKIFEDLGDRAAAAECNISLALALHGLGKSKQARALLEAAASSARSLRAAPTYVWALTALASIHLDKGEHAEALRRAESALGETERMLGGLSQKQAAEARRKYAGLYGIGALAAAGLGRAQDVVTFLESGRAGSLLESLGGRDALSWVQLPPALEKARNDAAAAEQSARRAYAVARDKKDREAMRSATVALNEARTRVQDVTARIQREAKKEADLFYPRAASLGDIQGSLTEEQALVTYAFCEGKALALVVRKKTARVVMLGEEAVVADTCEKLDASDLGLNPRKYINRLRDLIVKPLKLGSDVEHVLASPEGPLCYVPLSALFSRAISLTASGTTYVHFKEQLPSRGEKVLALGDPDYSGDVGGAHKVYSQGKKLAALPNSQAEAEAVGDTVLLKGLANENNFRKALLQRKRWRAVHLACHGIVDPESPQNSALALSSAEGTDGFLTAPEIMRMKVPADLVILSACETGRGKIVKGEGIVGLTRTFMYAGAPRVICSLWKVDDAATKALMVKFYELWNPKKGKGLSTAQALQKAQEHVRKKKTWKHPYYWAAWVLWGLPN